MCAPIIAVVKNGLEAVTVVDPADTLAVTGREYVYGSSFCNEQSSVRLDNSNESRKPAPSII